MYKRLDIRNKRGIELVEYIVGETSKEDFKLDKGSKVELLLKHPDAYFVSLMLEPSDSPEVILQFLVASENKDEGYVEETLEWLGEMLKNEICGAVVTNNILKSCEKPNIIAETMHYMDVLDDDGLGLSTQLISLIKEVAPVHYIDAIESEYKKMDEEFISEDIIEDEEIEE